LDAVGSVGAPFDVDVVVVGVGERLEDGLVRSVLGGFKVLYGSGRYVLEYAKALGDPDFSEAKAALRAARDYIELAERTSDELVRDRHIREAFNTLFHAARIASMVYLSTEVSRWGVIGRMLPEPYKSRFRSFIRTLHVEYFYHGSYPRDRFREEFDHWYKVVERFIEELESEVKSARRVGGCER